MIELAAALRKRLFSLVPDDVSLVVSSDPSNKGYLSGYHSVIHDIAMDYRSAVLATRERASLVLTAADAGPALELLKDQDLLFRYGEFYFETHGDGGPRGYNVPGRPGFDEAFMDALDAVAGGRGLVGVDRSDGDLLWRICADRIGEGRIVDVTPAFRQARRTKTAGEISLLRRSTELVEAGLKSVIANARVGMTEIDLARLIATELFGGGAIPRIVSVTSGPRSALADAYATDRKIMAGDMIRIDTAATYQGYWSDMARCFVFGEPSARQASTYASLLLGLEEELKAVKPGVTANHLFDVAVSTVRSNGIAHYKRQHCGHGIGLKTYDSPVVNSKDTTMLEPGMCLCLETPYYELNLDGMMVEDTIVVTDKGYEPITTISRELFVL